MSASGIRVAGIPLDWNLLPVPVAAPGGLLVSTSASTAFYVSPQLCSKRPGCSTSNGSPAGWLAALPSYARANDHLYIQLGEPRGRAQAAAKTGTAAPATVIYDIG